MTIVAVTGDCSTTTSLALAAAWPRPGSLPDLGRDRPAARGESDRDRGAGLDGVLVVEADPAGGCLAGWLDCPATPSLTTIVSNVGDDRRAAMATIAAMVHRSDAGIDFVSCPARSLAAHRAVDEAAAIVLPTLAGADVVAIADVGRHRIGAPAAAVAMAATVVLVHRQRSASAGAAAVGLERLVEAVEQLASTPGTLVLALIGDAPFDPAEIAGFVDDSVPGAVERTVTIADDALSAAVLAGRRGVSERRLARLPLMRSAAVATGTIYDVTIDGAGLVGAIP